MVFLLMVCKLRLFGWENGDNLPLLVQFQRILNSMLSQACLQVAAWKLSNHYPRVDVKYSLISSFLCEYVIIISSDQAVKAFKILTFCIANPANGRGGH